MMIRRERICIMSGLAGILNVAAVGAIGPVDFAVKGGEKSFRPSEARGKYVALHFLLKTECPYCLRHVQEYARKAPTVAGVVHVFLKPDTEEEIMSWANQLGSACQGTTICRDADAALAKTYGIPDGLSFHGQSVHYPALILLGPDGQEVFRYVGKDNTDRLAFDRFAAKFAELTRSPALSHNNLSAGKTAIQGYDPVAYIESGRAMKGQQELASVLRGVTYHFGTEANRARFAEDTVNYLPAYGGWCATAMAEGRMVDIDPASFKVSNGRVFLFYKGWRGDALKEWNKDEPSLSSKADAHWNKIAPEDGVREASTR